MNPSHPRIAVVGIGLVSRFGGLDETWAAALEGRDGAQALDGPEWHRSSVRKAAVVPERLLDAVPPKSRRLDRAAQLALAAAVEAWRDAGAGAGDTRPDRRAVLLGSSRGGLASLEKLLASESRISPLATSITLPFSPASAVSIQFQCRGPALELTTACASAAHAIGLAARLIQTGMADLVLAGGTEACVTPAYVAMTQESGILSPDVCRPFDRRRNGTLLGEGAAVLVLERRDQALARGARIRAELLGYGATSDAESLHAPAPDGAGLAAAMTQALRDAGVSPGEVGYVKAHGTGTVKGDEAEARAIRSALGAACAGIPVGSLKPVIGHTVGASAALEAALVIRALEEGRIPPTAHLEQPDPALGLNLIHQAPAVLSARAALVNAAGFGGTNACLVFAR